MAIKDLTAPSLEKQWVKKLLKQEGDPQPTQQPSELSQEEPKAHGSPSPMVAPTLSSTETENQAVSAPVVPSNWLEDGETGYSPTSQVESITEESKPASTKDDTPRNTMSSPEIRETRNIRSKEAKKLTSKLVNIPSDPAVNKVGYYLTRREIDQLDNLHNKLKKIMRDKYGIKITKNDIVRASLLMGLTDWEENQLTSQLVDLLTSK